MEKELFIRLNKVNPNAITPTIHEDDKTSDIFSAEDVFIAPNEIVAVGTGLAFIFPDDIGLMFMPIEGLREISGLRYPKSVFVLQNNHYSQEEVKIFLENTCEEKEKLQKTHEYKLIDGTSVSDGEKLYDSGTVKICKGDCIARMMPVVAFYPNTDDSPKKLVKK